MAVVDLSLTVKQSHWNACATGFRALHLHLDELADELRDHADELAKRGAALGVTPDGRAVTIAERSPLGVVQVLERRGQPRGSRDAVEPRLVGAAAQRGDRRLQPDGSLLRAVARELRTDGERLS